MKTTTFSKSKKKNVFESMSRPYVQDAWHFLLSENNSSAILADKVGFTYKKTVTQAGVVDWIHAAYTDCYFTRRKDYTLS